MNSVSRFVLLKTIGSAEFTKMWFTNKPIWINLNTTVVKVCKDGQ